MLATMKQWWIKGAAGAVVMVAGLLLTGLPALFVSYFAGTAAGLDDDQVIRLWLWAGVLWVPGGVSLALPMLDRVRGAQPE